MTYDDDDDDDLLLLLLLLLYLSSQLIQINTVALKSLRLLKQLVLKVLKHNCFSVFQRQFSSS